MPQCEILETFKGSQDGRFTQTFEAGTTVEVSEYLIACAPNGALRRVGEVALVVENKATITTATRHNKRGA